MRFWLIIFLLTVPAVCSLASTGSLERHQVSPQDLHQEAFEPLPGFNAALIVTPGDEFDKILNMPPDNRTDFTRVDTLRIGEQAELHVIFTNPLIDENNYADVTFDVQIIKPGNIIKNIPDWKELRVNFRDQTAALILAKAFMRLKADNSDPVGEWNILVTIHDNKRSTSISDSVMITLVR